jgi:hypothetical protein
MDNIILMKIPQTMRSIIYLDPCQERLRKREMAHNSKSICERFMVQEIYSISLRLQGGYQEGRIGNGASTEEL